MKKKILFIVSNLKIGGGAEQSTVLLTKGLSEFYDVELLTFYDFPEEYSCGVKRHSFKIKYSNNLFVKAYRILVKIPYLLKNFLKKNKYDLVVSNAEDANIPCLLTKEHHHDFKLWTVIRNNIFDKKNVYYHVHRLHRHADKRVVLTKETQQLCPFESVILENALDIEDIKQKSKEKISKKEEKLFEKKTILMIGRLAPQKNHSWFFDVFKELEDVNLLIIGSGPLEEELKRKAKGISNIHFLGTKKNVYPYLKKADVFVLPSLYEGMPRVLMEALACGTVCVVNDFKTGARELMKVPLDDRIEEFYKSPTGYVVEFNNKEGFRKAIKKALKKPKKKPDKRFGLETITKKWCEEIGRN